MCVMIPYCDKSQIEQLELYTTYLCPKESNGKIGIYYKTIDEETGRPVMHFNTSFTKESKKNAINNILSHACTDSYATCNVLAKDSKNRYASSIIGINQIYIDIDILHGCNDENKLKHREAYIEQIYDSIMNLVDEKKIPEPSMFIHSGRGLALYYKYDHMLSMNNEDEILLHDAAYIRILDKMEKLLKIYDTDEAMIEIDRRIRNYDRISRIPATMNVAGKQAAKLIFINNNTYSQQELYSIFGIDSDLLLQEIKEEKEKRILRKNSRKNNIIQIVPETQSHSNARKVEQYIPENKGKCKAIAPLINATKYNLKCLESYYNENRWIEGAHRERFIFIYYNCAKLLYGTQYAYNKCLELNQNMEEPLTDYELKSSMIYTDNHIELMDFHDSGVYTFKPETIVKEEWLDLNDEDAIKYGFLTGKKIKEKRKKYISNSIERDKLVAKLYLSGVNGLRTIAKMVSEKMPEAKCSYNTVKRIIDRLGITDRNIKYENINFKENRIYTKENNRKYDTEHTFCVPTFTKLEKKDFNEKSSTKENNLLFLNPVLKELYKKNIENNKNIDVCEYDSALKSLKETKDNIFLTGNGGTGKTKLINDYLDSLSKEELKKVACCSFTGKASSNLRNGKTIHNLFQIIPELYLSEIKTAINFDALKGIHTIIVDEIGQVRVDLFQQMMVYLEYLKMYYNHHIRVIVLGDFGQIQPVCTKEEYEPLLDYYGGLYAFYSKYWHEMNFKTIILRNIIRQNDNELIEKLNELKYGCLSSLYWFNQVLDRTESETAIYICPTNEKVDYYNNLKAKQFTNTKKYKPVFDVMTKNVVVDSYTLTLAVGMRIMTITNTDNFKNGELGTIVKLYKNGVKVQMDDGREIRINQQKMQIKNRVMKQIPIRLAFAITADKAQGMTFDEVNIVPGYFNIGQVYTVLTRCKTREGMHLLKEFKDCELMVNEKALSIAI